MSAAIRRKEREIRRLERKVNQAWGDLAGLQDRRPLSYEEARDASLRPQQPRNINGSVHGSVRSHRPGPRAVLQYQGHRSRIDMHEEARRRRERSGSLQVHSEPVAAPARIAPPAAPAREPNLQQNLGAEHGCHRPTKRIREESDSRSSSSSTHNPDRYSDEIISSNGENEDPSRPGIVTLVAGGQDPEEDEVTKYLDEFLVDLGSRKDKVLELSQPVADRVRTIMADKIMDKKQRTAMLKNIALIGALDLEAPAINPEITLKEPLATKDNFLKQYQTIAGASISQAATLLDAWTILTSNLAIDESTKKKFYEGLCSIVILNTDLIHMMSMARRDAILPRFDEKIQRAMRKTQVTKQLFGDDVKSLIEGRAHRCIFHVRKSKSRDVCPDQ
ncbi:hypothetical protein QAD02_015089 [Eretmocerus hayati]|uniref:Uncharacterized protein n=1 Tax=Eretmocerus hayati TaxID=131215 RepID=A0ACC2PA22_9HYME|nr:hypothetical protein QAD02_015089 [Eretmocerus hayati]